MDNKGDVIMIALYLLIWIVMGIIGAGMAERRGRSAVGGFFLGLCLSVVGLAIIALMGKKEGYHDYR
jgi:hypothetical protein